MLLMPMVVKMKMVKMIMMRRQLQVRCRGGNGGDRVSD